MKANALRGFSESKQLLPFTPLPTQPSKEDTTHQQLNQNRSDPSSSKPQKTSLRTSETASNIKKKDTQPLGFIC